MLKLEIRNTKNCDNCFLFWKKRNCDPYYNGDEYNCHLLKQVGQ